MRPKAKTKKLSMAMATTALALGLLFLITPPSFSGNINLPTRSLPSSIPKPKAIHVKPINPGAATQQQNIRAVITGFKVLTSSGGIKISIKNTGNAKISSYTLGVRVYQKRKDGTGAISGIYPVTPTIAPGSTCTIALYYWKLSPVARSITVYLLKLSDKKTISSYSRPYKAFDVSIAGFSWNNATRSWTLKIKNHMDITVPVSYYVNATHNYYHVEDWSGRPNIKPHSTVTITEKAPPNFHHRANYDGSTRIDRITAEIFTYDREKTYNLDKREIEIPCVPTSQGTCQ